LVHEDSRDNCFGSTYIDVLKNTDIVFSRTKACRNVYFRIE